MDLLTDLFRIDEELEFDLDFPSNRSPFRHHGFDAIFRGFIAKDVIKYLSPQRPEQEDKIDNLLKQIEKYIFGLEKNSDDQDVANAIQQLQTLNQPNKVCRRALKPGDVHFACNDCGLDATCVVCIDCFHKSAHKDHNYRMANSDGGGCCDCGDMEAWYQHHACTEHLVPDQPVLTLSDFENTQLRQELLMKDKLSALDKIRRAPKTIASRYFLVCEASLQYAHQMLTWEDELSLPHDLERFNISEDPDIAPLLVRDGTCKNFFTVLFNDEVHTYDHVINTLVKIIKCTKMTASVMASTVSREGRSLILNDNRDSCRLVKDMISNVRDSNQSSLKVELMHGTVLAHQAFALKLIGWIRKMASLSDVFRILTAWSLLEDIERDEESKTATTLIEAIMIANTTYWKIARVEWNDLFVVAMLTDTSMKDRFARLLTRNYRKLMGAFIADDHDHSVSILTMTTQTYTVPSLVCMLIEEENALSTLTQTLIDSCNNSKRIQSPSYESRHIFDVQSLKRGYYIIADIKYLISIKPTKWTPNLRLNVIGAVKIFLNLLDSMQNMDSVRRQMGQHLEYEPDWESGMTLQGRLIQLITRLVTFCSYDEEVLVEVLKESQRRLIKYSDFKLVKKELSGYSANCIQYDVSSSTVSVHLPLTRFTAAFILELMKRKPIESVPYTESKVLFGSSIGGPRELTMLDIMEPSLRTEVMIAQFRSGMWRRNGYSLVNQILYYHGAIMRSEMFDRDILALQECAAMTEPNVFLIHMLNKFQLFTWVESEQTREPLVSPRAVSLQNDEEILAQTMSLGEEFLQLLLTIVGERYCPGVGVVDEKDVIKNEIIQLLCIKPLTRSDLNQKLCVEDNELDCAKCVANFKRSDEASTGKYELKEEFYDRFNPFFYHYTRRQQSNALDAQLKRKKNLRQSLICCPPPTPVELTPQFRNLNELIKCDITLLIMMRVLLRATGPTENFQECSTKAEIRFFASDLQLDQCLHIIGIGLHEQDRDPSSYKFIENAHFRGIFQLLKSCYEKAKRSRDLIFWLMKKTNSVLDKLDGAQEELTLRVVNEVRELLRPILSSRDNLKQANKKRNSDLAAQLQNKIMAMMKKDQEKFLSNPSTQQLVAETERTESKKDSEMPVEEDEEEEGHDQKSVIPASPTSHLCILCRDQQKIGLDQNPMVLLAYIQRSSLLSKNRKDRRIPNYALTPSNQLKHQVLTQSTEFVKRGGSPKKYSFTTDNSWSFDATFMPSDLFFGPYISSCSHAMHYLCWEGFFQSILKREKGRPNRNARHVSFEIDKFEVLCPLCECISNAIIPLLPNYTNFIVRCAKPDQTIFLEKSSIIAKSSDSLSSFLRVMRGTVEMLKPIRHLKGRGTHSLSDDKYLRLLQPDCINKVLEDLEEDDALGLRDFINATRHNKISSTDCSKNLLIAISGLAERIHFVGLDLDKSVTDVGHSRMFMMTAWSISYTTQAFERVSRFKGIPLFEDAASPKGLCLTSLIRYAGSCMITLQSNEMQNLLALKLRYLLVNDEYLSSSPCCLDIDAFETFVSIFFLLPKIYSHIDDSEPAGWTTRAYNLEYFRNLLHLTLILNLLQCMITLQNELTNSGSSSQKSPSSNCMVLQNFYRDVILTSGHPNSVVPECNEALVLRLKCRLLPFLRSCAIFFRHFSDISPPLKLQTSTPFHEGKNFTHPQSKVSTQNLGIDENIDFKLVEVEFNAICSYLDLPNQFSALLSSQETLHLARSWLRHSRVLLLIKSALEDPEMKEKFDSTTSTPGSSSSGLSRVQNSSSSSEKISTTDLMPLKFIKQPHMVNRLIELPYDYSELVDKVSSFSCPSIKAEDSRTPTLCLVCGTMLCSQSYCCQRDLNDLASNYQQILHQQQDNSHLSESSISGGYLSQSSIVAQNFMQNATALLITDAGFSSISPAPSSSSGTSSGINQQLVGSCTHHAFECSGGIGVFLRIRNCQILLLSGKSKGCYMPAPYIDDHGETDSGLIRGNPLRLNRQLYEKLQNMWLMHAIPEQVSRTLEYSPYASSINWHLH